MKLKIFFMVVLFSAVLLLTSCGGGGSTTHTPSWGTATLIEDNIGDADSPQIAVDSNGNATAVWRQEGSIYANCYVPGRGWGTPEPIEANTGDADSPQIAVDGNGNAITVWRQADSIYANRYDVRIGSWGTAEPIETNTGTAYSPQIAADSNGNAIAVWRQNDGIYANRYNSVTGWGTATLIENNTGDADSPQIAMDSDGNAIAVWREEEGPPTSYSIYSNRYNSVTGWGIATLIGDNTRDADSPQISMDGSGNAIAVWRQVRNIYANHYDPVTGWGTATPIEYNTEDAKAPQIALDSNGNAIAMWSQDDGTEYNIYANRYDAVTGSWDAPTLIETNIGDAMSPQIAIDGNGNAIAVWCQMYDGTSLCDIYANRYVAGKGWGTATLIENNIGYAQHPQIAMDNNGSAMAVWADYTGTEYYDIWANRFR